MHRTLRFALPLATLALAACAEHIAAPEPVPAPPPVVVQALACSADVRGRAVDVRDAGAGAGAARGRHHRRAGDQRAAAPPPTWPTTRPRGCSGWTRPSRTCGGDDARDVRRREGGRHPRLLPRRARRSSAAAARWGRQHDGEQIFMAPGEPFFNYAVHAAAPAPPRRRGSGAFACPRACTRFVFSVYLEAPVFDNRPHPPTYGQFPADGGRVQPQLRADARGRHLLLGERRRRAAGARRTGFPGPGEGGGRRGVAVGHGRIRAHLRRHRGQPAALLGQGRPPRAGGAGDGGFAGCRRQRDLRAPGRHGVLLGRQRVGPAGHGRQAARGPPATPVAGGHTFVDVRVGAMPRLRADGGRRGVVLGDEPARAAGRGRGGRDLRHQLPLSVQHHAAAGGDGTALRPHRRGRRPHLRDHGRGRGVVLGRQRARAAGDGVDGGRQPGPGAGGDERRLPAHRGDGPHHLRHHRGRGWRTAGGPTPAP